MSLFEPLFAALNECGVRYVVVGGVAVVLHGFARLTVDVDLVVDLEPEQAGKAMAALTSLGLVPRVPVQPQEFADPEKRASWIRDKHMRVFTMLDPTNPMRQVDLFVESPIDFQSLYNRAELVELATTTVRVASVSDLVAMKEASGRPQDRADIEALKALLEKKRS